MEIKDKNTNTIFDDYVNNDWGDGFGMPYWTQVCESCAKKHHLLDSYLDINSGHGICGVQGCNELADHYYDFEGEIVK